MPEDNSAGRPLWPADATGEQRALLDALREELRRIVDPLLHDPLPEGSAGRDPLEALVSSHVDATLRRRGWWGIFALQTKSGAVDFGLTTIPVNLRLRSVRAAPPDWQLAPKSHPLLLPSDSRLAFEHLDGSLWVGLDIPGVTGRLTTGGPATIDFHVGPANARQRILTDRLQARPWSAMLSADAVLRQGAPVLAQGADSMDPLAEVVPPHRLLRNLLRLPATLLNGLERFELAGKLLYWMRLPWPEPLAASDREFIGCMRRNAVIFSDRLPGVLNAGIDASRIPRSRDIAGAQGVVINRVWDIVKGRPRYDRREFGGTSRDTYALRPVLDSPDVIAELQWDEGGGENVSVEYEYVPLEGAPSEVKVGDAIDAEHFEAVRFGELLQKSQEGTPAINNAELWRAFASGLAGRGRAVTAREIRALVCSQDYMALDMLVDPDVISLTQHVGRVQGRRGVVPYTQISIRLPSDSGLSGRDRQDAEYLLEQHLAQTGALNHNFKVRLFDKQSAP